MMGSEAEYFVLLIVCFLFSTASSFDLGKWAGGVGAADPCDKIRGENLLHHVLNDNILAAKFFFTAIQTQDPNLLTQCISRWDRYFPVPRPKYPDSPFIRTPLTEAARRGNMGMVRLLVQQGADVNKQSEGRWTALMWSAFEGNLPITRLLISRNARLNARDYNQDTALHLAATNGQNPNTVKFLLTQRGVEVNAVNEVGRTPLMGACENGWWQVAWALIRSGADINMTDREGVSALMLAVSSRNMDLVRMLVEQGDYWTLNMRDSQGRAAVDYAANGKMFKIVKYLQDRQRAF